MCQFNFIALKETSGDVIISKLARDSDFDLKPVKLLMHNQNLRIYATTRDECDCASILGKGNVESKKLEIQKERKKLERKRLSKNRIESLLSKFEEQFTKNNEQEELTTRMETDNWQKFIDGILNANLGPVGIFYKQFSGAVSEEKINEKEIAVKNKINAKFLKEMVEQELYWFTSASR